MLVLILAAALALRIHQLGRSSFWLDEILTVQLSVGRGYSHLDFPQNQLIENPVDVIGLTDAPPTWRIWTTLDRDVHPPLYYLLLRAWREIVGDTDVAIRMLPATLSLASIVMLYLAMQPLNGSTAALWACLLMALAGPQIEYAQENRSYMLLLTAPLGAAAAIVRIEKLGPGRLRCVALGIAILTALLTHYLAVPVVGLFIIYAALRLHGGARRWSIASIAIAIAIFALAWGPFCLEQMRGFAERIAFTAGGPASTVHSLRSAAELPLRFLTRASIRPVGIGSVAALLYLLPLLMLRKRGDLMLWWMWLVGYVSLLLLMDLIRGGQTMDMIRYALPASPAAYALMAALLGDTRPIRSTGVWHVSNPLGTGETTAPRWQRHIVPALLSIACLAALPEAYVRHKEDWRSIGRFFAQRVESDDVIIIYSGGDDDWRARCMYVCLRYYAPRPLLPVGFISGPDPSLLAQIAGRDVWLLRGAYVAQDRPLLPGWEVVEMTGDPQAAVLARLRPE